MEIISKESILNKLSEISRNTGLILGLAGSYARGTNDKDSDCLLYTSDAADE